MEVCSDLWSLSATRRTVWLILERHSGVGSRIYFVVFCSFMAMCHVRLDNP
jgi:hypothetical protein